MENIKFQIIIPDNKVEINLIANWYFSEWKIPIALTIKNLQTITEDKLQFQVLMTINKIPIATAGLYNYVQLLDKEPRLKIYKNWLGLVYTIPDKRHHGYGALLCEFIQNHSKKLGLDTMYLFTDTSERLYNRLGWNVIENLILENRNIVVMKKEL